VGLTTHITDVVNTVGYEDLRDMVLLGFWAAADRAKASPAWRYREIATSHMIASNRPAELARLLLELT
jgi:hypothetical protein